MLYGVISETGVATLPNSHRRFPLSLGNLIDNTSTGVWRFTMTATYFSSQSVLESAVVFTPVSARRSPANAPSHRSRVKSRQCSDDPTECQKSNFLHLCLRSGYLLENCSGVTCSLLTPKHLIGLLCSTDTHSPIRELQSINNDELTGVAIPNHLYQ
jgi:hypothetical protein